MSRTRKKNKYRQSRAFDRSCRCHGGCPYCEKGRQYGTNRVKSQPTIEDWVDLIESLDRDDFKEEMEYELRWIRDREWIDYSDAFYGPCDDYWTQSLFSRPKRYSPEI